MSEKPSQSAGKQEDTGVADAVRTAVERTLRATAPAASQAGQRAVDLLDEVSRVGREAGAEISRRGQVAGAGISKHGQGISKRGSEAGQGLARIGQEATSELSRRLETLERRLASLEAGLKGEEESDSKPKAEG